MGTRYDIGDRVKVQVGENQGDEAEVIGIEDPDSKSPTYKIRYETGGNAMGTDFSKASQLKKTESHMSTEDIDQAVEEAREMGREFAKGIEIPPEADPDDFAWQMKDSHTQSATWANHTLPNLRAMAGFEDSGMGTYQEGGMRNEHILQELVDAYWEGATEQVRKEAQ